VSSTLSIGQCATLACLLEVIAPKAGNVHRGADFEDLTLKDFAVSAAVIGPAIESAASHGVGHAVLAAIRATRQSVGTNTNLGTVLLIAPLAAVPRESSLADGIGQVLTSLTREDSKRVYEAIRLAQPGGMGQVDQMDLQDSAPANLLDAMRAAADRDMVARQYADEFQTVLNEVVPSLLECISRGFSIEYTIIHTQMQLLSRYPDSLISRKCGRQVAQQAAARAEAVIKAGSPGSPEYERAMADLDFWMRSDHHHRNPGTTADLIAAGLFAALREGQLTLPFRGYAQ
jgi:triphosphoribosyl-dephospho-CoA synthase